MREISAIDAEIEATEGRLTQLKRERTDARLPEFADQLMVAFSEAFHEADLASYGSGNATCELADGVHVRITVSIADEASDNDLSDDF